MGIETAFLIGVLVGQWILFWVLWRVVMRRVRLFTIIETKSNPETSQNDPLANSLLADTDDNDTSYDI